MAAMADENEDTKGKGGDGAGEEDGEGGKPDTAKEIASLKDHNKRLSDEAGERRRENKTLKDQVGTLQQRVTLLDTLGATPEEQKAKLEKLLALTDEKKDGKKDPDFLALKREFDEYRTRTESEKKEATEKSKSRAHKAAVAELLAEAKIAEPADATTLLMTKTRWDEAKEVLIATVKDEDGNEQEVTIRNPDALKKSKLLSDIFWPAEGAPGSGARATRVGATATSGGTLDVDKAMSTQEGFLKHREAIRAELKRRNAAGE